MLGLYTLNMGYLFDGTFRPLGKYVFNSRVVSRPEIRSNQRRWRNRFAGTWLGEIPVPLPADFVQGIDTQRLDFERGLPSYLRGEWADHGWWYYYLYALAIKEPLGTWCLVALAIGVTIFGQGYSASWRDEMVVLVPFLVIFVLRQQSNGFFSSFALHPPCAAVLVRVDEQGCDGYSRCDPFTWTRRVTGRDGGSGAHLVSR